MKLMSSQEAINDESIFHLYNECVKLTGDAIGAETDPFFAYTLQQVLGTLCWQMQVISERKAMMGSIHQDNNVQAQEVDDRNMRSEQDMSQFDYDIEIAYSGARRPWRRILLYGPPGTGKTRLAQAIAAQSGIPFYCISSADLLSSWVGESEKLVRTVFKRVRQLHGPTIIFIDEIDGLCRKRTTQEEDHSRRMKTELLNQMEGNCQGSEIDNIILLGATNCPWDLDTAFMRRFQRHIYIPLPDRESRKEIIKMHSMNEMENMCDAFSESDWNVLLNATVGYSGSDLANLSTSALLEPIKDLEEAVSWMETASGQMIPCEESHPLAFNCKLNDIDADKVATRKVMLSDFLKGVTVTPKTNSDEDIAKFTDYVKKYGSSG